MQTSSVNFSIRRLLCISMSFLFCISIVFSFGTTGLGHSWTFGQSSPVRDRATIASRVCAVQRLWILWKRAGLAPPRAVYPRIGDSP